MNKDKLLNGRSGTRDASVRQEALERAPMEPLSAVMPIASFDALLALHTRERERQRQAQVPSWYAK